MKELEKAVLAVMLGEALHPNQQKIDVVDDDKIDAKDFAKLRAMKNKKTGKIHNCAVHVEHPEYGEGSCISEAHADPDEDGNIAWYTAKFETGTYVVQTEDINILASESHMHEEVEQTDEAMSHQASTTMKHIKPGTLKQNYGDRKDAANIKPGIKGVADRFAMLDRAKKEGRLKEEAGTELDEAKGLAGMTMDQLKQEHDKVQNKINDQGKSKMISMNHPLSQRARSIRLHMAIKKKQANEEVQSVEEMDKSMAYATGTKRAMQMTGDKPPLEKSTIKKAHNIAKAMLRKEEVEEQNNFQDYDELVEGKPFEFDIKGSYTFGEYLTAAKKLVGEEQAIELANTSFNKQNTDLFLEEMSRDEVESRVKSHMNAGHQVSTPKYSTRDGQFHAEFVVKDKESGVRRKYIYHGNTRRTENMGTPGKRD